MIDCSLEDIWDNAPCGHIIARPDGRIVRVNATLSAWLGYTREALQDNLITDLMTVGGRIHYDTHFGPLLQMQGELNGVTLDLVTADGTRLPMFLTANVKRDSDGRPELIRVTAVDAADRRSYENELLYQRQRAESEQQRVRVFAETLRRSLLPAVLTPPDGLEAAAYYHTASHDDVGGDFYDLFPLSRTTWGFFLGDVMGKGVDAAVVTGLTRYALRAAAVYDDDPEQVLHNLNTVLRQQHASTERSPFCTVLYGRLTKTDNGFDVEIASGGHPPPLQLFADGSAYYVDTTGGYAVGMIDEPRFVANRFHLSAGDALLMYTDGLTEASTGVGRHRYDDDGALLQFANAHSPTTASVIVSAVQALLGRLGAGVEDDAAVLALGVPPNRRDNRNEQ